VRQLTRHRNIATWRSDPNASQIGVDTCPVGDGCHLSKWNNIGQLTIWRRVLLGVARGSHAIGVCLFHLVSGSSRPLSEVQGEDEISNIQA
jgi:hypothetical protein